MGHGTGIFIGIYRIRLFLLNYSPFVFNENISNIFNSSLPILDPLSDCQCQCCLPWRTLSTHDWASDLHKMNFTSTGDPLNNHMGKITSLYLDPLLSALSAMEDIQDTCFGGYPVGADYQIYIKWSSLPLGTHGWVGMQWPTRHNSQRTHGFLFKTCRDLSEFEWNVLVGPFKIA